MTRIYKLKTGPNFNFFDPCKSVSSVIRGKGWVLVQAMRRC